MCVYVCVCVCGLLDGERDDDSDRFGQFDTAKGRGDFLGLGGDHRSVTAGLDQTLADWKKLGAVGTLMFSRRQTIGIDCSKN